VDEVFASYLDPAFRYVFTQSPARVRDRADARRSGLNCVALAHLVIRDLFGHALPAGSQSVELFGDLERFEPVPATARLRAGDLVWLGAAAPAIRPEDFVPRYRNGELLNFAEFAVNHVAIATGDREDGDVADGSVADGDVADGSVADGDVADGGVADGDVADGGLADGDELLLHASPVEGTVALWPSRRFRDHDRYRTVYAVRRLRERYRSR
jgi:hypothetical protein